MNRPRPWLLCATLALGAANCRTFDPKHPMTGQPRIVAGQPGYWIWVDDGRWHLRISTAPGKVHRFQGSLAGVGGGISELSLTRPELKDRVALVGDAVQFDVESADDKAADGFDVRVVGGCARFDLYFDGKYHSDRVHLGPRAALAHKVPFEKCP
jgi:hypothetical protein